MSELVVEVYACGEWLPLSLDANPDAACASTALEALRDRAPAPPNGDDVELLTALLAGLSRAIRAEQDDAPLAAALVLLPDTDPVPVALATVRVLDTVASLHDVPTALLAPVDQRYDEPLVDPVRTPLGSATRVAQRFVDVVGGVQESLAYLWPLPEAERSVLLSATFSDLIDAGRWSASVDRLAHGVAAWVEH